MMAITTSNSISVNAFLLVRLFVIRETFRQVQSLLRNTSSITLKYHYVLHKKALKNDEITHEFRHNFMD